MFRFIPFAILLFFTIAILPALWTDASAQTKQGKDGKYTYEYVENDPIKTRIYTLQNGLKVYLSANPDEPRILTLVPVRTGSKEDPRDNTGLAHYLEHMVFKGTDQISTTNWEVESGLIKQISDLYELHKQSDDPAKKSAIYRQIDSLSYLASTYAIPNEYDKMVTSLGAKNTNAYTSSDETVYINDIPANELERWLQLEAERFSQLVLRLFHTELETVYEEFNMGQDRDGSKVYEAMLKALFPTHPYNISTIGLGEHLKNPSMEAIHRFFDTYYVPNNMAVCLAGDLDYSKTIALIDQYMGKLPMKPLARPQFAREAEMTAPIEKTVMGKEAENVTIAFRFDGAGSNDAFMLKLMDGILQNGQAGIMDINLIQKQKILKGGTYKNEMSDYSMYVLTGVPRQEQSLEEVLDLLLSQIELLKQGQFDQELLTAVIKNFKLSELKNAESNWGRAGAFVDAFITGQPWESYVTELKRLEKVTKADVVKFVNDRFQNNYAVIFKRTGEDPDVLKMDKPPITQVELNRDNQSEFFKQFEQTQAGRLQPAFVNYKQAIKKGRLKNGIEVNYIQNILNPTFNLYYVLDMGTNHLKKLGPAIKYLPYLGTDKYTAEQLQLEFYKLGVSFDIFSSADRVYVSLSGLEESFEPALKLFEHVLGNVKPDEEALKDLIAGTLKERGDSKKNKNVIFNQALANYGMYGPKSEFTHVLSEQELKSITGKELTDLLKQLTGYQHYIFYYGQNSLPAITKLFDKYHKTPAKLKEYPKPATFTEQPTNKDRVYFINYNMVQAQISMIAKDELFNKNLAPMASVYGEYFGGGLSSIVFQEIREARALAYSAAAFFTNPAKPNRSHYSRAFMAVQADKMAEAIDAMRNLLNNMPKAEKQFDGARTSVQKQIETERTTKTNIFFSYLRAKDRGLDYDLSQDVYQKAQTMTIDEMEQFFNQHIKGKNYTFLVIGDKTKLNMEYLQSLGEFKELTLEEIFGY
ncbi:MAG TPA: insulinase family protein [Chitinophagales bacterium]|nr:insulinase family protein [Chitinophagales bacterium]